jgi:hypothetical protein
MVKMLPDTREAMVLRTDFSDEIAWTSICAAIRKPQTPAGFQAQVEFVSDPAFAGITAETVFTVLPESDRSFLFIIDPKTLSDPEHPILVVDLLTRPGRTFRVIPSEVWGVENNLTIANLDFADFASSVDADGVFRGFPDFK